MNKLAIFVEGETEQLFVERFVRESASRHRLKVEMRAARVGRSMRRTDSVQAAVDDEEITHYVLILDCKGDGGVKSRIVEGYRRLAERGYSSIIGLRDAPKRRASLPALRAELPVDVPCDPIPVHFVIAVMEIEAWFLAEHTHFGRIDPRLTPDLVQEKLGFRPAAEGMTDRDHPARDLDQAYGLVEHRYQKGRAAQRTIYLLDCEQIAFGIADDDLAALVRLVFAFFDSNSLPDAGPHIPA